MLGGCSCYSSAQKGDRANLERSAGYQSRQTNIKRDYPSEELENRGTSSASQHVLMGKCLDEGLPSSSEITNVG